MSRQRKKKINSLQKKGISSSHSSVQNNYFYLSLMGGLSLFGFLLILIYYYRNSQSANLQMKTEVQFEHTHLDPRNAFFQVQENDITPTTSVTYSEHKKSFFNGVDYEKLKKSIEQVNISWHSHFLKGVQAIPDIKFKEQMQAAVKVQIQKIRKVLPELMHPKVLLNVINDPTFSIQISHRFVIKGNGLYNPDSNTIYVALDISQNEEFIKNNLKNEMHSAAIRKTNFAKQSNPGIQPPGYSYILTEPFAKDKWQTDIILKNKFELIIKNTEIKIDHFISLFKRVQSNKIIKEEEREIFNKYMDALQSYQPRVREISVPYKFFPEFERLFSKINEKNFKFTIPQVVLYPSIESNMPIDAYITDIIDDVISQGKTIRYKYAMGSSIQEKARAFIAEYFEYTWRFKKGNTIYSDSPETISLEKSSDIEEMRPNFPYKIYQEWCDYFSTYHEVDDYCGINNRL